MNRYYVLHGVPPFSLNEAYQTIGKRRHKDPDCTTYQNKVKQIIAVTDLRLYGDRMTVLDTVQLTIMFYIPRNGYITGDGAIWTRRYDCSNYIKLLEDAVFEYLDVDDALNTCVTSSKCPSWDDQWHIAMILSTGLPIDDGRIFHHGEEVTEIVYELLSR